MLGIRRELLKVFFEFADFGNRVNYLPEIIQIISEFEGELNPPNDQRDIVHTKNTVDVIRPLLGKFVTKCRY